jgi:hypothetical protein
MLSFISTTSTWALELELELLELLEEELEELELDELLELELEELDELELLWASISASASAPV